jgi:hypothetical protein
LVPRSIQTLWIEPTDNEPPELIESAERNIAYLNRILALALRNSINEAADNVGARLNTDIIRHAYILLEHANSEEESKQVLSIRRILTSVWSNLDTGGIQLRFSAAEWDQVKQDPEMLQACHGIVLVDRSRTLKTLDNQTNDIEDELARCNRELERRIFVLPPKEKPTTLNWPAILFKPNLPDRDYSVITNERLQTFLTKVIDTATDARKQSTERVA